MNLHKYITVSPDIQFGKPVFKGTRVTVQTLFFHLEQGISLNEFLQDFPGVSKEQKEQMANLATDKRMKHLSAILDSMTPKERSNHNLLDAKRKRRVASGSGRPVQEVNQLIKQYLEMKKMMTQMNDPKFMTRMQRMAGAMKGGGMGSPF